MLVPEYITEQIDRRFNGRFRLRWSDVDKMFLFEQKVKRGIAEGFAPIGYKNGQERKVRYEDQIRARDGYILSMQISPGTTMNCKVCNTEIKVPAFKTAQVSCPFCEHKGRRVLYTVGYFPLSDSLLDELDRTDIDRGGDVRVTKEREKRERMREAELNSKLWTKAEAAFRQDFNLIVGIPQKGMHGKVLAGTEFANFKGKE